jgi:excisionase family DNA binding protein
MVVIDGVNYLTVDEVCRLLDVKPATIYAYVSRGVLRSYKQGIKRQRLYRDDDRRPADGDASALTGDASTATGTRPATRAAHAGATARREQLDRGTIGCTVNGCGEGALWALNG